MHEYSVLVITHKRKRKRKRKKRKETPLMLAVSATHCRSEQDLPVHTYMLVVPVISDLHPPVVTYASRRDPAVSERYA
jgi:hypothetical protein